MSLGNMMGGAVDIASIIEQLKNGSGGNVIIINPGQGAGGGGMPMDMGPPPGMPPMPPEDSIVSNGAPPALGPDAEGPVEDAMEGGKEEPQDMLGAVKAGLDKMPKKGPPKAPSKGAGKGAPPGTAGRMKEGKKPPRGKAEAKPADKKISKAK